MEQTDTGTRKKREMWSKLGKHGKNRHRKENNPNQTPERVNGRGEKKEFQMTEKANLVNTWKKSSKVFGTIFRQQTENKIINNQVRNIL